MIKILSLGEQDWIKGICPSDDSSMGGTFISADGFDLSYRIGTLKNVSGSNPVNDSSVVTDIPKYYVPYNSGSSYYYYIYGSTGKLYKLDLATNSITDSSSAVYSTNSVGNGMIGYLGDLIYSGKNWVRRHKLVGTNSFLATISSPTAFPNTFERPMLNAPDGYAYICNVNTTASYLDKYDGTTYTKEVLDWDKNDIPIALDHDGQYIVIGTTDNYNSPGRNGLGKIKFWDSFSPSWSREYTIPGYNNLSAIKKNGDWFYAFTKRGIYRFNFSYAPTRILPTYASTTNYGFNVPQIAVDNWRDGFIFRDENSIYQTKALTPIVSGQGNTFFAPYSLLSTETITSIKYDESTDTTFFGTAGASGGKIVRGGGSNSSTAITPYIDLNGKFKIEMIKLVTSKMTTGCSITVSAKEDATGPTFFSDVASFAKHGGVREVKLYGKGTETSIVNQLSLTVTLSGTPVLKRLELWGSPVDEK